MSQETFPVANVGGKEIPYDPDQLRRIQQHPCFSEKACHSFGRMHLAVAPKSSSPVIFNVRSFVLLISFLQEEKASATTNETENSLIWLFFNKLKIFLMVLF